MFPPEELAKFSEAGRVISQAAGVSVELWARAEAGVILKAWAGKVKVADGKSLGRSGIIRAYRHARAQAGITGKGRTEPGQVSINLGFRGSNPSLTAYYRTRKRGAQGGRAGFQSFKLGNPANQHIASRDWPAASAVYESFRSSYKAAMEAAKTSAGLARQSIIQIADDLGIRLESVPGGGISAAGVAKARAAMASNGRHYRNGYSTIGNEGKAFYLTLINRYPKAQESRVDTALAGVVAGRVKYFQRNLAEGVFLSMKRVEKAYPYLKVLKYE